MRKFLIISIIIILSASFFFIKPRNNSDEVVVWTLQLGTFDKYMNSLIAEFETQNPDIKIKWIDSEKLESEKPEDELSDVSAILVPGGFGQRGTEGKIKAIKYARECGIVHQIIQPSKYITDHNTSYLQSQI